LEYFSMLEEVTASKKAKAEARRKFVDVMEILLDKQHAAIKELDA
jgi:ribosomal protein L15E